MRRQVFGRRLPVGFVIRIDIAAEDGFVTYIHGHGQVVRPAGADQVQHRLAEHVRSPSRLAGGAGQVLEGGVVRPVDLGMPVDDIEGLVGH